MYQVSQDVRSLTRADKLKRTIKDKGRNMGKQKWRRLKRQIKEGIARNNVQTCQRSDRMGLKAIKKREVSKKREWR